MDNRESNYLELLARHSRDIFLFVRLRDGRILECNAAALQTYGYSKEEMLSLTIDDLRFSEIPPLSKKKLKTAYNSGILFETMHKRKDGTHLPVEVNAIGAEFEGERIFVDVVRDISDRKRNEAELQKKEQQIRAIAAHTPDHIFIQDRELKYQLFLNPPLGLTQKDVLGKNDWDFLSRDEAAILTTIKRKVLETGESTHLEVSLVNQNGGKEFFEGSYVPTHDSKGIADGLIGYFRNVTERRQVEENLREREESYRALVAGIPDIVLRLDRGGRYLFASEKISLLGGIPASEFIGKTNRELGLSEEHCRIWDEAIQKVIASGKPYETEFSFDSKNGQVIFDWRLFPEFDSHGNVQSFLSINRDITEHRRMEKNYQLLFREMPNGFAVHEILCDEDGNPVDYRFLAVNPAFERITGLKAENILGKTVLEILPDTEPYWIEVYGKVALTGEPAFFQHNHQGLQKHFEVTAFRSGQNQFACFFADITERVKTEESLNIMKQAIEIASDGSFWTDYEGRFVYANDAACKSVGYDREQLLNMHIYDVNPKADIKRWHEVWNAAREAGTIQREAVHRRKDGSEFPVEVLATYVSVNDKNYICGFARDISERIRQEEEKEILSSQLQQAQKMESVGRLAGGVAHDFNNMLGVILGHAELALEQVDPSQPLHDDLMEIYKAGKRSSDLTRQLLAFARKQTVARKVLDLNETIGGMLRMLERLIGENISLQWQPTADLWSVMMDPSQIDQILANLCVNAKDAIGTAGVITLKTENCTLTSQFCATHVELLPGDYVRLDVRDDGCGMDSYVLTHIFEPFFTTKKIGEGTGLGLSTIYGIVKQNKGHITVQSQPAHGSTFTIYLPRHIGEAIGPQAGTAVSGKAGKETILLVEDEPGILKLTTRMLENQGYEVLAKPNPGEAIQAAREFAGNIHLLITDVVMPEMNGHELSGSLLAIHPRIKCLFMSGYTADVIAQHGILEPNVSFIQKPFYAKDLTAKVREVLDAK